MNRRTHLLVLLIVSSLGLSGCFGTARVVQRNQAGGVLALAGWPDKSNQEAHAKMSAHCGPGNYTIVEESEAVIGSSTSGSGEATSVAGVLLQTKSSETQNKTEPRLSYVCNSIANQYVPPGQYGFAPPAPMPPPPGAPAYPAAPAVAPAMPPAGYGYPASLPTSYPAPVAPAAAPAPYYPYPPAAYYPPPGTPIAAAPAVYAPAPR